MENDRKLWKLMENCGKIVKVNGKLQENCKKCWKILKIAEKLWKNGRNG